MAELKYVFRKTKIPHELPLDYIVPLIVRSRKTDVDIKFPAKKIIEVLKVPSRGQRGLFMYILMYKSLVYNAKFGKAGKFNILCLYNQPLFKGAHKFATF